MRDAEPALRKREVIITSVAFETWVSRLFASFEVSKEGLHGKVNANRDILQDLRMDTLQAWTLFFQHRIGRLLPVITQTFALLEVRRFAVLKQVVREPSALFKDAFKAGELVLCRVEPILKVLSHGSCIAHFKQYSSVG